MECVKMHKEMVKLLNDGGYCLISKFIIGDETYILFFEILTCEES